jgi:hypothetical protein
LKQHIIDSIKCVKINCEKLIFPYDAYIDGFYFFNPDSVMIDSCQNPPVKLARKWFFIEFEYYVIDLTEAPEDTLYDVTWESISSSYTILRTEFQNIENLYETFKLRKNSLIGLIQTVFHQKHL